MASIALVVHAKPFGKLVPASTVFFQDVETTIFRGLRVRDGARKFATIIYGGFSEIQKELFE